jgi:hypothetical protein
VAVSGNAPPIMLVDSGAPPITLFNDDGSVWAGGAVVAGPGGAALLANETDGFAIDATHEVDARRVAKKVAGVVTEFSPDTSGLVNSTTSPKMVYDVNGTLVWSPHNFVLQSENVSVSPWTYTSATAPTATRIQAVAGNSTHLVNAPTATQTAGSLWTWSGILSAGTASKVGIKENSSSGGEATFDLSAGTVMYVGAAAVGATITSQGGGQYLCTLTLNVFAAAARFTVYILPPGYTTGTAVVLWNAAGTETINIFRQQTNRGHVPTAYLPVTTAARIGIPVQYAPLTHTPMGLLSEPAATNSILWSADLTRTPTWAFDSLQGDVAYATAGAASPDGRTEGVLVRTIARDMGGATPGKFQAYIYQNTAGSITGTMSVFAKAYPANPGQLVLMDPATAAVVFDLTSGQMFPLAEYVGTPGNGLPSYYNMQALPGGWWRCSAAMVGATDANFYFGKNNSIFLTTATDDGLGFYLYGPQLEATNTVATSFIPTFGAALTRATDSISIPVASTSWNAAFPNSVVVNGMSTTLTSPSYFGANDGTDNNRITVDTSSNTKTIRLGVISGAATYVDLPVAPGPPVAGVYYKAAMAIAANDCAISVGGAAVVTDTSLTLPAGTASLTVGNGRTAGGKNTYIRTLMTTPRRMTNTELQQA